MPRTSNLGVFDIFKGQQSKYRVYLAKNVISRKLKCDSIIDLIHNVQSNWWQGMLLFDPYYVLVYKYDLQQ